MSKRTLACGTRRDLPELSGETLLTLDGAHSYDFDFNCESGKSTSLLLNNPVPSCTPTKALFKVSRYPQARMQLTRN